MNLPSDNRTVGGVSKTRIESREFRLLTRSRVVEEIGSRHGCAISTHHFPMTACAVRMLHVRSGPSLARLCRHHLYTLRRVIRASFRRVVSLLLLSSLVAGVVGLPVLSLPAKKAGRFPCESCPCGCATAESCWDNCCCHSDVEKLDWAAVHGVQPPAFLVARVAASGYSHVVRVPDIAAPSRNLSCCHASAACERRPDARSITGTHVKNEDEDALLTLQIVRLEDAAKCRGVTRIWTLLSRIVVDQAPLSLARVEPHFLHFLAIENDRAVSGTLCPDPPIP